MSVLFNKLVERLSRFLFAARPIGSNAGQAFEQLNNQQTVMTTLESAVAQSEADGLTQAEALADAKAVEAAVDAIRAAMMGGVNAQVEPVMAADALTLQASVVVPPIKAFRFAMRLRLVAKLQARKKGRVAKPIGKARANLKPKPVVAVAKPVKKRGADLFATKVKLPVAKRPTTKIYIEKRPKRTAEILAFPVRKPLSFAPRLKRAA